VFREDVADTKERAAIKLRSVADPRIRNTTEYVRRLFGEHVPEIANGVVRICAVGRIPGVWAKVAVETHDPEVDPVRCCVGAEASRVQAISAALDGEGIDIIPWASDLPRDIANAIAPAIAEEIIIDETAEFATVRVSDHQLAAALGPDGNNVRLASDVCQCRIDVESTARVLAET
jgi:N utilization substance protein A